MQLQPGDPVPEGERAHYLQLQDWPTILLHHFFLQVFFELQAVSSFTTLSAGCKRHILV